MSAPPETAIATTRAEVVEALDLIRATLRELRTEVHTIKETPRVLPDRLAAVVESIGQHRPARKLVCLDEFLQQWEDFLEKRRTNLESRAVRYLCWEPDVGTDRHFVDYLHHVGLELSARSLQGLVRSCHNRWEVSLFGPDGPAAGIRARLHHYSGSNRIVAKWQANRQLILAKDGAARFAADMVEQRRSLEAQCAHWAIDPQSRYVEHAMQQAASRFGADRRSLSAAAEYALREVFFWIGWPLGDFKRQVGELILLPNLDPSDTLAALLRDLVLADDRLRDPRLPANAKNWTGVQEEARARFIGWLSKVDIEFFFEHVLPNREDEHGRKPFWLKYVKHVQRSRPLLCSEDHQRLLATRARMKEQIGNFGRIEGGTSAFLLDFGRVLVVEFSRPGNACYFYGRPEAAQVVPNFWTNESFVARDLKQLDRYRGKLTEQLRIVHREGWQYRTAAPLLAKFGIRSG